MLTKRLKDDNWALHQIAERQETPASLIKGQAPREAYVAMLGQQLLINRAMDAALRGAIDADQRLGALVSDEQMFTPYLEADLAYFCVEPGSVEPKPGTARYIAHIESKRDEPLHLLGLHYVRLGACNGNRFVARVVRKAYGLNETQGTRYLDPFGEAQREGWAAFKSALDALPLSEAEQDAVFEGTRSAYVYAINLDHEEHHDAERLLEMHGKTLDREAFERGHSVHVPAGA